MNPTIENNFRYHPPTGGTGEAHARIRSAARDLAQLIDDLVPQNAGREKATAIAQVESAMMWACAGIVRHSPGSAIAPAANTDGRVDWKCDCCGWRGGNLTIAEAPLRHKEHNQIDRMICSGNLKPIQPS